MARTTHRLLIPLAALLAILPLILKGGSCGHDEVFHVQGWFDAAAQLRHLHYPHWSFTSAWSAGEPRFLFYPPLSWLLGAALTLIFPPQVAVYAFIFLCLTLSGFTMHRLAAYCTSPNAALLAAVLYLANPYMLFNAFERTAFAELLASAWIPLLLLAVLRSRPTIRSIAIPFALLWLTNAPAAVMGSYAFALLATLRFLQTLLQRLPEPQHKRVPQGFSLRSHIPRTPTRLAATCIAGTALGLSLPAFFLVPAAYEQRFIQTSMALVTNMRIQDNFFFDHTLNHDHNGVNLQISLLGVTLLALTLLAVLTLLILHLRSRRLTPSNLPATANLSAPSTIAPHNLSAPSKIRYPEASASGLIPPLKEGASAPAAAPPAPLSALLLLTATLTLMLYPLSLPLWNHIPELAFLQFPWRLLTLLSAVLTFTLALLANRLPRLPRLRSLLPVPYCVLACVLGFLAFHLYAQFCQPNDRPPAIAQLLRTHHGFAPTDEYTPLDADSDVLRTSNPAFWLAPPNAPNTPAPNTRPTPSELDPTLQSDDTPVPPDQAISYSAPSHLALTLPHPATLILNLRDYPDWQTTLTTPTATLTPAHLQRDDGLLAIPVPAGYSTLDIRWRTTPDQRLGLILSTLALLILLALLAHPAFDPRGNRARKLL
jgi:hypothetical protein